MKETLDINWFNLSLGYILLIIPVIVLWHYRTGLVKETLIAIIRMTLQLLFIGLYLEFIFALNFSLLNIAWVIIMTVIAAFTITNRSSLSRKIFVVPVLIGIFLSLLIVDAFFLGVIIRLRNVFDAQYLIPISGMIIGNCMRSNIIAMNTYYSKLYQDPLMYRYSLANGATKHESLLPYMREALRNALNPLIATISVMGLISIPGMLTGQILGGSSPVVAIKYQILISISIMMASILSVYVTVLLANRFIFDEYDNVKGEFMRMKGRK